MPVLVIETTLPVQFANAGMARRLAMEAAARLAAPEGHFNDHRCGRSGLSRWIAANLAALHTGAEVVAGRAELNTAEATRLPRRLQDDDEARESETEVLFVNPTRLSGHVICNEM